MLKNDVEKEKLKKDKKELSNCCRASTGPEIIPVIPASLLSV